MSKMTEIQQIIPSDEESVQKYLDVDAATHQVLLDHRVRSVAIVPGSFFIVSSITGHAVGRPAQLGKCTFQVMAPVPSAAPDFKKQIKQTSMSDQIIFSDYDGRSIYATINVDINHDSTASLEDLRAILNNDTLHPMSQHALYERLATRGNDYGEAFQSISELCIGKYDGARVATGQWRMVSKTTSSQATLTCLFDAAAQVVAAAANLPSTFVLKSVEKLLYTGRHLGNTATISTRLDAAGPLYCRARVQIHSHTGELIADLGGIELTALNENENPNIIFGVSGTFTLDPLEKYASVWSEHLHTSIGFALGDYGQIFQELLNDTGAFSEQSAMHISFLRLEDWVNNKQNRVPERQNVTTTSDNSNLKKYQLSNGKWITHLNRYETDYLDQEIFVNLAYRRHGIGLLDNDTVIDIGANIGLFSLFANEEASDVRVVAIEPSPYVLPMLKANLETYCPNSIVIEAGVGGEPGQAEFTAYPKSSVFSTFSSDQQADEEALRVIIRNTLIAAGHIDEDFLQTTVEEILTGRMGAETFTVSVTSISKIIRDYRIEQIGLLKIDAEKSEEAILRGIEEEHWPLIEQIIVEVHTQSGATTEWVTELLHQHGFEFVEDEETLLNDSGLVTIYAFRPDRRKKVVDQITHSISDSVNLYLDAVRAHSKRTNKRLLTVMCPTTKRDPLLEHILGDIEARACEELAAIPRSDAIEWNELTKQYPVSSIADNVSNELGHIPYSQEWYAASATAIFRRYMAQERAPYKVLALDCDNTLWKGIVGEQGPEGIEFTEGCLGLHRFVKEVAKNGMLLCLVSKNAERDVLDVFLTREDLDLRLDDFTALKVNWNSKSANLRDIAEKLNLGLDSFIFLDDSPIECAEVRSSCPEILTLQLPSDDSKIVPFLEHVWAFDRTEVTDEDLRRAELYREENLRNQFREQTVSMESFISGLELVVDVRDADSSQLERVSQLTQRTNQFNLTTIRRSVEDVKELLENKYECFIVSVSDRFGDYGITGVVIFNTDKDSLVIDSLLLSCRVLGRGVEHLLIAKLGAVAESRNLKKIMFPFEPTAKNEPARKFLDSLSVWHDGNFIKDRPEYEGYVVLPVEDAVSLRYIPSEAGANCKRPKDKGKILQENKRIVDVSAFQIIADEMRSVEAIIKKSTKKTKRARPDLRTTFVAPQTDLERSLVRLWCDVLSLSEVGVDDNFFELGGTSLAAVEMVSEVHRKINARIAVVDVFDAPNIAALVKIIEGASSEVRVEASKERGAAKRKRTRLMRRHNGGTRV